MAAFFMADSFEITEDIMPLPIQHDAKTKSEIQPDESGSKMTSEKDYIGGLFDFLFHLQHPQVRPANVWDNPFTCPLPVLCVLKLQCLYISNAKVYTVPQGTVLPPALHDSGLSETHVAIESDLCQVLDMINDAPEDLTHELRWKGYLGKMDILPSGFWDSALVSLARKENYSSIRSGGFRSLTQMGLETWNFYQPYTLPHAELLASAFEEFYTSLKQPGILIGRLQRNPYTTTILDRRLRHLDKHYHKTGEEKLALPHKAASHEWSIVADELVIQFRKCLKLLKLERHMTIQRCREEGFLDADGLLPNEFFGGPMSSLADVSDHGELYNDETHGSIKHRVIMPILHSRSHL